MVSAKVLLTGLINQSPQYVVDQSRVPIHFVSTKKDWAYCQSRLLKAQLMGFDTETRPVWTKGQRPNPSALLQIAVRDASHKEEVFVLDLLQLPVKVYNATLSSVFLSNSIVKLGQSFYQDLQELAASYPNASCFTVCKNVVEVNDLSISLAGAHNPLSLQKMVFFYLNQKLAKTQQRSNWERRPLSPSQLHYAAADALVLIHLYDELMLRIQKQSKVAATTFRLSDVSNVLDVNLAPALKCSLCFDVFETPGELKKHRKICVVDIRTLEICTVCEGKKLVRAEAMKLHVKNCGLGEEIEEPAVQVKRTCSLPRDNCAISVIAQEQSPESSTTCKNRRKKTKGAKNEAVVSAARTEVSSSSNTEPTRKRKRNKKKVESNDEEIAPDSCEVNTQSKRKKKHRKLTSETKTEGVAVPSATEPTSPASANKKNRRKAARKARKAAAALARKESVMTGLLSASKASSCGDQERKKRKMSMESSLLASDTMWSQINNDCTTAA